ncbi:MAG: ADP-ribosylglycohydrolase family protein [Kofleriaceae bacterium]
MTNPAALARAWISLEGLAVGDALGEALLGAPPGDAPLRLPPRPRPWPWTDDTAMAISIVEVLAARGDIDPDDLAVRFASRYQAEPWRGYGGGAHAILAAIAAGTPWREASGRAFDGQGSHGNGAAMRAAPIGAYFAGDPARAAGAARASAAPTHAHPEGAAGAIAIAVLAAAVFAGERDRARLLEVTRAHTPSGEVARGLGELAALLDADPLTVAATVGNGARVSAADTVPFAVWCALRHLDSLAAAVDACVDVGGDVDTTAAMAAGIVVGAVGLDGIPMAWRAGREALPPRP